MSDKDLTILFVDDDPDDCLIFAEILKELDLEVNVLFFNSGEDILAFLAQKVENKPIKNEELFVISLDLNMPVMSGFDVLEALKLSPKFKPIPVIIFSTSMSAEDVNKCYANGAVACINKPSKFRDYNEVVSLLISFWRNNNVRIARGNDEKEQK